MPAAAQVRRVFIGLLVANVAVVGVKFAVGITSGSLAVLGGAVDSSVDALNNVLAVIVVRVSSKEPDEDELVVQAEHVVQRPARRQRGGGGGQVRRGHHVR